MDVETGYLICPRCNKIGMSSFRKYESKTQYINNKPKTTYILFESYSACICFYVIRDPDEEKKKKNQSFLGGIAECAGCCGIVGYIIFGLLFLVLYIIIFVWFDIANVCCMKKKRIYKNVIGYIKDKNKITKEEEIFTINIWKDVDGISEETINSINITKCPECKYVPKFSEYIKKSPQIQNLGDVNESENQIRKDTDSTGIIPDCNNDMMSVVFQYVDMGINYPIPFLKDDKFQKCKEKLFKEYPELKNKKVFYFVNARVIDETKTMFENGIKSGNCIIIQDNLIYNQ